MHEHWAKFGPPLHIVAGAYFGITKKSERKNAAQNWNEFAAAFSAAGGGVH